MLPIQQKLTPHNYTQMENKKNPYIVVHYVGAVSTAKNNVEYYAREKLQASAHYFVDETSIWQSVLDSNKAWHCGGGLQGANGHTFYGKCTNSNSIGIEMCCKKTADGKWYFEEETVKNTVDLIKYLMEKYDVPIDRVIRHYDVTGKNCPAPYVDENAWSKFKERIVGNKIEEFTSINDIVWELGYRGLVTDKEGMIKEMTENPNGRLYWLARKAVQYMRERD